MKQWQLDFLKPQSIALTLLLLIQACLLFYNFSNIAISHDELSALYRCRFQSFNELINEGVVVDGHPALVQVLLWSLIHFCGASITTVKLPFILFSLISTFYFFKIGIKYFGIYTALLAGIFFISLEYFLYIIRTHLNLNNHQNQQNSHNLHYKFLILCFLFH
jgi:4-amino-4-deoxy-L-arabinose transferase-like glycosyltransferase